MIKWRRRRRLLLLLLVAVVRPLGDELHASPPGTRSLLALLLRRRGALLRRWRRGVVVVGARKMGTRQMVEPLVLLGQVDQREALHPEQFALETTTAVLLLLYNY
jgi:hypothetical protein